MYILFTLFSFSLFSQNFELEGIIYSDKIQSSYEDSIQNIRVIEKENFKNEKTIEDVLRNIPGVSIKRSAGVSSFRYRGLPSRYTLILVNGKRVFDAAGIDEGFNLDSIDVSMLDRVEIINGTSSLAYGAGSYASVINLITESFNSNIQTQYGARQRINSNLSIQQNNSSFYSKVFYERDDSLSAIKNGNEKDTIEKKGLSIGYQKDLTVSSGFKIDAYGVKAYRDIDGFLNSRFQDLEGIYSKKDIANISMSFNYEGLKVSSLFYSIERQTRDYRSNNLTFTNFNSKNYVNSIEWKRSDFLIGFEHDNQRSYSDQSYSRSIKSIYAIKDLRLSKKISISASVRLESLDQKQDVAYALGAINKLNSLSRLSFNYSSGFKRASFYQLRDNFSGNTSLENETTQIWDLSYQFKENFKLSLFLNEINNQINYVNPRYENTEKEISKGIETKVSRKINRLDLELGATVFDTSAQKSRVGYFFSSMYSLDFIKIYCRLNYIDKRSELGVDLDDYSLLYLGIEKSVKRFKYSFSIYNAFNESYEETSEYETLGRNYELGLSYSF